MDQFERLLTLFYLVFVERRNRCEEGMLQDCVPCSEELG